MHNYKLMKRKTANNNLRKQSQIEIVISLTLIGTVNREVLKKSWTRSETSQKVCAKQINFSRAIIPWEHNDDVYDRESVAYLIVRQAACIYVWQHVQWLISTILMERAHNFNFFRSSRINFVFFIVKNRKICILRWVFAIIFAKSNLPMRSFQRTSN